MPGTLYVVATPIGNLGDLSDRARRILASVAVVACEDTRVTGKLLHHFGIEARMVSYHEHNEARRAEELLGRLKGGEDVALVSDAGTPLVSDPGYRLVAAARESDIAVRAVPGPSALLAALAVSGLPTSAFTFAGFLPRRGADRKRALESLRDLPHTIVLFEAPTRAARLLQELASAFGARPAVLLREMTKLHEEHWAGTLQELAARADSTRFRGEVTLVVSGLPASPPSEQTVSFNRIEVEFAELREAGRTAREAAKVLADRYGLSSRALYQQLAGKRGGGG
jgi:16S rRNA (cytidine1402-2'-O)-methyltransferase